MTPQHRAAEVAANTAAPIGWGTWIVTHIAQINGLLQTALLIASIVATVFAARYHWRKSK